MPYTAFRYKPLTKDDFCKKSTNYPIITLYDADTNERLPYEVVRCIPASLFGTDDIHDILRCRPIKIDLYMFSKAIYQRWIKRLLSQTITVMLMRWDIARKNTAEEERERETARPDDNEKICQLCKNDEYTEALITPCKCDSYFVHRTCFNKYKQIMKVEWCHKCSTRYEISEEIYYPISFNQDSILDNYILKEIKKRPYNINFILFMISMVMFIIIILYYMGVK